MEGGGEPGQQGDAAAGRRRGGGGGRGARAEGGADRVAAEGSGAREQGPRQGQRQRKPSGAPHGGPDRTSVDQQQQAQQYRMPGGAPGAADAPPAANLTLPQQLSRAVSMLVGRHATDEELLSLLNPAVPVGVWRQGLNETWPDPAPTQMCMYSLLNGALHPECPERLAVHACGVLPGQAPFFSQIPLEVMVSHPTGTPFYSFCDVNRAMGPRNFLAQQWAQLDPDSMAHFEQQARAMQGVVQGGG
ncbi:hypothetical protein T484DRAFT_1786590, partial [Baffinella frigidus]